MHSARGGAQRTLRARPGDRLPRCHVSRLLALFAALALAAGSAWAERWDVAPTLAGGLIYTDNVSLVPDVAKQSASVVQVVPGISITAAGARSRFSASYTPEFNYYNYARGRSEDQLLQRGNANVRAELAKRVLFVDAGAKVDQYAISVQDPLAAGGVNTTGNRATVKTFFVTPQVVGEFGSAARAEARLTHSILDSDSEISFPKNKANGIDLQLASGRAYKLLTWDIRYRREDIDYEAHADPLTEVITAKALASVTPHVRLLAQAGYESYDSGIPGLVTKGSRWAAGLEWTPTPRTQLTATAGERLDGDAYSLDFRHRTRLTAWSASYSEDVTTSRSEFFVPATTSTAGTLDQLFLSQFPDPAERQKAVQEFIARTGLPPSLGAPVNFFSEQLFLAKKWQASVAVQGIRNTVIANAFRETREASFGSLFLAGTGDFAASNSIRQIGMSLAWNWRATARSAWNLSAGLVRSEFFDANRVDDLAYARIDLTRLLQPKLTGSLYYRWQDNDSSQSASSYTENVAGATLQVKF